MIRRCFVLFFLIVALATPLRAQIASSLSVTASKSSFVFGEPIKVTARVRDAAGAEIRNAAVSWFVDPPTAGTIATDGTVTPLTLQSIVVRGAFGNTQGEITLQILPKRIDVKPQRKVMTVGGTQFIRAEALDFNDRPIPNIVFRWNLTNLYRGWDNSNPMAAVSPAGLMTAYVQGTVLIGATLDYATLPGLSNQARGETTVEMRAAKTYDFERIFAADARGGLSRLMPRTALLLPTEDDGFTFVASLDSTGLALLKWQNGTLLPLLASGRAHIQSGQPLLDFLSYAGNHSGEMLTAETDISGNTQISSGAPSFQAPLLVPGTPLFIADRTTRFDIQRNSLADSGFKLVSVNYTEVDTLKFATGLFRGEGNGLSEKIVSTLDSLPGYAGQPFSFRNYGIASDGTAWFSTAIGTGTVRYVLWKQQPFGAIERVLGDGDAFQGSTVRNIATNTNSTTATMFVASNGDVVVGADTVANIGYFVRWTAGDPNPQILRANTSGIYWHEPGVGTLITSNVNNRGNGLYLWTPQNDTRPLLLVGAQLDGSAVTEIQSAVANSRGVVFAMVSTANNPMLIVRLQPDVQVVLRSEDHVAVSVPPVITALLRGRSQGLPTLLVGGQTGSIARVSDDGSLQPILSIGDALPGGRFYRGSSSSQVRTLPDGGLVFGDLNGLHKWDNGTISVLVPVNSTVAGVQITTPTSIDVNSRGDVAAQFGGSGNGLYFVSDGVITKILRLGEQFNGDSVTTIRTPAIDDTGRVAFYLTTDKGEVMVQWRLGSALSVILFDGMALPGGRAIRSHDSFNLNASADSFFTSLTLTDNSRTQIRYRNSSWDFIVTASERMPNGSFVTFGGGTYAVNRIGDIEFQYFGNNFAVHLVAKRTDTFFQIQDWGELTDNGDLLLGLTALSLLDDGTGFALATTDAGQQVLYRANPISGTIEVPFTARSTGGVSMRSAGNSAIAVVGYSNMESVSMLSGMAIFGNRQGGVLVSEAAVPASLPITSGRIYAEVAGAVNTGLAIANPNVDPARISYYFTRSDGTDFGSGTFTLDGGRQIAAFLDQTPYDSGSFTGTFTFSSSVPVGVVALRGYTNTRGEFLITTLPVTNLSHTAQTATTTLPHFATGGGWATQILLVNPSSSAISGTIQFYSPGTSSDPGTPLTLTLGGQNGSSFAYSIPAKTSIKLAASASGSGTVSGTVRVIPANGQVAPSSLAVFSFTAGGAVVAEAGVSGLNGTSMLMYAEASGVPLSMGSIQTGVAIANPSSQSAIVILELRKLDGSSAGVPQITFTIPANAQVSKFLNEFFPNLVTPFQGVLKITSGSPVSVAGLRGRTNERNHFLITTTPPSAIGSVSTSSNLIFPHLVDGGGYTTQIVIIGNGAGDFPGTLQFFTQFGLPLPLTFR